MTKLSGLLRLPTILLLCLAIPAFLITTNLRVLLFDRDFYSAGFAQNGVIETTGMSEKVLAMAAEQMITYFEGGPPVSLVVDKEWGRERVFNDCEQTHLADVRDLVWLDLKIQSLAAFSLVVGTIATIVESRRNIVNRLARRYLSGAAFTLGLFGLLLVGALADFSALFLQFHLLSFTNDFWQLDPRTDYMIRMFPYPFWYDAAVTVVVRTVAAAFAVLVMAVLASARSRRTGRA